MQHDLELRIILAEQLVRFAGEQLLDAYHTTLSVEQKGLHDYVTDIDSRIEQHMRSQVAKLFPDDVFFGEERGTTGDGDGDVRWIVDPIDGTNNFVRSLPLAGTQIAIEVQGTMKYTVISQPFTQELYWAVEGRGAYYKNMLTRKTTELHITQRDLSNAYVIYDSGSVLSNDYSSRAMSILRGRIDAGRVFGVAVVDFPAVASGSADLLISSVGEAYDIAPGLMLVKEAGGVVLNERGETWQESDRIVIAGHEDIVREALELINTSSTGVVQ